MKATIKYAKAKLNTTWNKCHYKDLGIQKQAAAVFRLWMNMTLNKLLNELISSCHRCPVTWAYQFVGYKNMDRRRAEASLGLYECTETEWYTPEDHYPRNGWDIICVHRTCHQPKLSLIVYRSFMFSEKCVFRGPLPSPWLRYYMRPSHVPPDESVTYSL